MYGFPAIVLITLNNFMEYFIMDMPLLVTNPIEADTPLLDLEI